MRRTPLFRTSSLNRHKRIRPSRAKWFGSLTGTNSLRENKGKSKADWSIWALKCRTWFLNPNYKEGNKATYPDFRGKEKIYVPVSCMFPGCGKVSNLNVDHVIPRSNFRGDNWDPCNHQILCQYHNFEKGSQHGKKWDFRTWEFKVFQRWLRRVDWVHHPFEGWVIKDPSEEGPLKKAKS